MSVDLSLYRLILEASLIVQLVMVILVLASVFSWMIIVLKWRVLKAARQAADEFEDRFWSGADLSHLYDGLRRRTDIAGMEHVFSAGFKEFLRGRATPSGDTETVSQNTQRAMRVSISREGDTLETYLNFLATVGSTSPYIGLFGTVWGIMHAFIGLSGVQQATLAMVAPGIAEALIATALGLFAAIPAVIAYNSFSGQIDRLLARYDNFSDELAALLQRQLSGATAEEVRS
ncbi:Cell division and transport-associated protein TolQ [Ectothiorhodosinus mongolicus]|uniref:Tol-Pal system protein TolQ n=1 Tax=Ectothiorhodosinus mongolicus TaxID=233100 RepID=A0A1R3W1L4_9GAMM|nr:protein TolQ [Ectothiorhodosinus mongolicus]ULX57384.1 protein TolQ [Ectothiorhodosinus mongolicus]SIT71305.1 Cell division and transport-associated protein TolQ [Ectothiorhodosinus mongolicus]